MSQTDLLSAVTIREKAGKQAVTVTYEGKTATFEVTVKEASTENGGGNGENNSNSGNNSNVNNGINTENKPPKTGSNDIIIFVFSACRFVFRNGDCSCKRQSAKNNPA